MPAQTASPFHHRRQTIQRNCRRLHTTPRHPGHSRSKHRLSANFHLRYCSWARLLSLRRMPTLRLRHRRDKMRRRSRAGGYCQKYMAVSASYLQQRATCSSLLTLLADPVRDILGEICETLATENLYATLRADLAAHLFLQFADLILLHTTYQGNAGLVAAHLSRPYVCLEQLGLQKFSAPSFSGTLGTAGKGEELVAAYRNDIELKFCISSLLARSLECCVLCLIVRYFDFEVHRTFFEMQLLRTMEQSSQYGRLQPGSTQPLAKILFILATFSSPCSQIEVAFVLAKLIAHSFPECWQIWGP